MLYGVCVVVVVEGNIVGGYVFVVFAVVVVLKGVKTILTFQSFESSHFTVAL